MYITQDHWTNAKGKQNASTMIGSLLEAVFPLETLFVSNYGSGHSKTSNSLQKKAFNKNISKAIFRELIIDKNN